MNLFLLYQQKIFNFLKELRKKNLIDLPDNIKNLTIELPPKGEMGDISCNAALILSKCNNKTPQDLALIIKDNLLNNFKEFEKIDIAKKGFLNIKFNIDFWRNYLFEIVKLGSKFGSNTQVRKKYNVEFVSANPTGPLHVGHSRGAVLGDVLSNLLKFNGHLVTKEYYVNDFGVQIENFVKSVYFRILELTLNKKFPDDVNLYPGDYILDIAKKIIEQKKIIDFSKFESIKIKLTEESLKFSMELIKSDLNLLGIEHDQFVYESDLIKKNLVSKTVEKLKDDKFIYVGKLKPPKGEVIANWKSRDQLLFKSTLFGDDNDRALQKNDGSWTYFASDIAYHAYKVNRDFEVLINILGADHSGYIKRITAATKAVSKNKTSLICKVSQLVKLFKDGKPFKMSKRKGDYITLDDLINEVGKDAVRFMMLSRNSEVELDFDFEKVTEKSKENPVYYVQYAYARINSIFRTINLKIDEHIKVKDKDFLLNDHEIQILKKISEWPKCVELSVSKLEPHRIPFYLYELVTLFHSYWNLGNDNKKFRFITKDGKFIASRIVLLQALAIVIQNGMSILGVNAPSSM